MSRYTLSCVRFPKKAVISDLVRLPCTSKTLCGSTWQDDSRTCICITGPFEIFLVFVCQCINMIACTESADEADLQWLHLSLTLRIHINYYVHSLAHLDLLHIFGFAQHFKPHSFSH